DCFQEQGDPRTLRFAAPAQPPKHLSRDRLGPQSSVANEALDRSRPGSAKAALASAAMAKWAPSASLLGNRTKFPRAPIDWQSPQNAFPALLPMSVRWRRKDWQLKLLPHNNDRAPSPRAVAHMSDKPAESRMRPYPEPNSEAPGH